jgi:hypothetical protein
MVISHSLSSFITRPFYKSELVSYPRPENPRPMKPEKISIQLGWCQENSLFKGQKLDNDQELIHKCIDYDWKTLKNIKSLEDSETIK